MQIRAPDQSEVKKKHNVHPGVIELRNKLQL